MKMFLKAWFFVTIPLLGVLFISVGYAQVASLTLPKASVIDTRIVSAEESPPPNILVVMMDDASEEQLNRFLPDTRKFIEENGIMFRNSYVVDPLCCPMRSSFFTGQYVHNHLIKDNEHYRDDFLGGEIDFRKRGLDQKTIAVWLNDAGYATGLIGKYLNLYINDDEDMPRGFVPPGWDEWQAGNGFYNYLLSDNGTLVQYGDDPSEYSTTVLQEKALKFIRDTKNTNSPFFLYFAPTAPHKPAIPAPGDENLYPNLVRTKKPNFCTIPENAPVWLEHTLPCEGRTDYYDKLFADGARSLKSVDRAIMSFVDELKRDGRFENTMIVVMNDNGFSFLDHTVDEKECVYEECVRNPIGIVFPKEIKAPRKDSRLISSIDITATIADVAHAVPNIYPQNGKSLLPVFRNPNIKHRDAVLIEEWLPDDGRNCKPPFWLCAPPTFKAVVGYVGNSGVLNVQDQKLFKYVELPGTGEKELYNLTDDVYELHNVSQDPLYADAVVKMKATLDKMVAE